AIGAGIDDSAPWKAEETIIDLSQLPVLSGFSRFGGCHLHLPRFGGCHLHLPVTFTSPDTSAGMERIVQFLRAALSEDGQQLAPTGNGLYAVTSGGGSGQPEVKLTTQRDQSLVRQDVQLLGLDHPLVASLMERYRSLPPHEIGTQVRSPDGRKGVLAIWSVTTHGERGETKTLVVPLAIDTSG